jgi:hypothetical protein
MAQRYSRPPLQSGQEDLPDAPRPEAVNTEEAFRRHSQVMRRNIVHSTGPFGGSANLFQEPAGKFLKDPISDNTLPGYTETGLFLLNGPSTKLKETSMSKPQATSKDLCLGKVLQPSDLKKPSFFAPIAGLLGNRRDSVIPGMDDGEPRTGKPGARSILPQDPRRRPSIIRHVEGTPFLKLYSDHM